jgi:ABC-type transporter Mla subunit MlaD
MLTDDKHVKEAFAVAKAAYDQPELRAEIERLRAENERFKATLEHIAAFVSTAADMAHDARAALKSN